MESQLTIDLAGEINQLHDKLGSLARTSLDTAIEIGELLTRQKSELNHGEWLPWCRENLRFSQATATKYLAFYRDRVKLLATSNLGIEEAYRLLSQPAEDDNEDKGNSKPLAVASNTGEFEWYTPTEFIERAKSVMGGIDLDPASCATANETVKATRYYSMDDDGLNPLVKWEGRIWMNPPYKSGLAGQFAGKLIAEFHAKRVNQAIVLVNNATDTAWFAELARVATGACFKTGRIAFINTNGEAVAGAAQGQVFIYFGTRSERFHKEFSPIGWTATLKK